MDALQTTNFFGESDEYNPKQYALEFRAELQEQFSNYLNKNKYCWINTTNGSELYSALTKQSYNWRSDDLPYQHWKQQSRIKTNIRWDDTFRQYTKDNIPIILERGFYPGKPAPFFKDNNIAHLNYFKPFEDGLTDYTSTKDLSLWSEYLTRLFPNESEKRYVEMFLAHMLQHPDIRPTFGLMLTSQAGVGKSYLFQIFNKLLNGQAEQCSSYAQFTDKFSTSLDQRILTVLDDVVANTERQMEMLRPRITEPKQLYEAKGITRNFKPCYARIMLFSNLRSPLRLQEDDKRRWYVPAYIKHPTSREETAAFIKRLHQWVNSGGYEDIYQHLLRLNISTFDAQCPPETDTLLDLVGTSKSTLDVDITDYITATPAFSLKAFYDLFQSVSEDLLKAKLLDLGVKGIGKDIRLLKNHPDPLVKNNNRYVYFGDRQAAIDYLALQAHNPF